MIEIELRGNRYGGGSRVSIHGADNRAGAAVVAGLVERGWRQVIEARSGTKQDAVLECPPRTETTQFEAGDALDPDCSYVDCDERDE